jgi:hypothetical protein
MQNKRASLIESMVNTASGFVVNFAIQLLLFAILSIEVKIEQNLIITATFTIASISRNYIVRRVFNKSAKS